MFATKKMKKINAFENVKVLSVKDIYEKLGPRVPQMKQSGGVVVFGRRKLDEIVLGSALVDESLNQELLEQAKQETQPDNNPNPEPEPDNAQE